MEITIRLSRPALIVFLILALTLGLTGSQVLAQPPVPPNPSPDSPELTGGSPVPGGPGYVSLSPYDFISTDPSGGSSIRGGGYLCNGTSYNQFYAPVQLPNGAQVNKLVMYYKDNNASSWLGVYLYMHPLLSNSLYSVGAIESTTPGAADIFTSASTVIDSPYSVVNLAANSYMVYLNLASGTAATVCLTGVRVDYGYPSSLPLVVR